MRQFGQQVAADGKHHVIDLRRGMDRLVIDAVSKNHVLLRPDEVDGTACRIADLEGNEGGDGFAQRGGMAHRSAQGPEGCQRLALAKQHADVVSSRGLAGIVEDCQEGGIGNEAIRAQLTGRDAGPCQHRVQLHPELRQQARQLHQRGRALNRGLLVSGGRHVSSNRNNLPQNSTNVPLRVEQEDRQMTRRLAFAAVLLGAMVGALASPVQADSYKMSTPIAPGVATPDSMDSSIGPLMLRDGFPTPETKEKIWDNLDRSRALQAYLLAIPIVNQAGMRDTLLKFGPVNRTNVIWENLVDPKTVELTANDNTIYSFIWIDTKQGPVVVEIPPKVLGTINDFWYKWVVDVGITGPDKGAGGRYLILPPGYTGDVPEGYIVVRPTTYGMWTVFRSFLVDGKTGPGVEDVKNNLKIYALADAATRTPATLVNASGIPSNFVMPTDYSFWELLNKVIQEEPPEGSDPTTLGLFASIGIEKGSGTPNTAKVGKISRKQLEEIAKTKTPDLTAADLDAAVRTIAGSARSMGVEVEGV